MTQIEEENLIFDWASFILQDYSFLDKTIFWGFYIKINMLHFKLMDLQYKVQLTEHCKDNFQLSLIS